MTDSTVTTQQQRGSVRALVLATLAFALCFSVWGLVAPLAPLFRETYGLSNTQVGFLLAVPVILGSLLRIPAGIVTDRYGARIVFPWLLLLLVVPITFAALSRSYGTLIGAGFLLGMTSSPAQDAWQDRQQAAQLVGQRGSDQLERRSGRPSRAPPWRSARR